MYPSNLCDQEWSEIEHFFRRSDPRGAKSIHSKHTIVNAVLYVVKSGCQWRMLPHDFPPWQSVYDHYRRWNQRGIWQVVERTFAWFGGFRRLSKDSEILTNTAENMIRIAMIKVTLAMCLI